MPTNLKKVRRYAKTYTVTLTRKAPRINRTYRLPVETVELLERLALRDDESMADIITKALKRLK